MPSTIHYQPSTRKLFDSRLPLRYTPATFQAWFSSLRTCNSRLQNTGEPLPRDTGMITQNVTLSDAEDCKIQKRNKIEILGSR